MIYFGSRMPITVVTEDENSGELIVVAEYGQEYGKDNPIRVFYDGYSHYDVLKSSEQQWNSTMCIAEAVKKFFYIAKQILIRKRCLIFIIFNCKSIISFLDYFLFLKIYIKIVKINW